MVVTSSVFRLSRSLTPRLPHTVTLIKAEYDRAMRAARYYDSLKGCSRAEPRRYRIVGPASGFDDAALDAVRAWKFGPPQASDLPEPIFAYAVLGFRALLTLPAHPRD
jgi:hypothetical protein